MESSDDSIREYLPTQQTILRSELRPPLISKKNLFTISNLCRVLLASIRKGNCPCPRCLTPISKFSQFGARADTVQRTSLARSDNDVQRFDIKAARRIIYEANFRVNNDATETILKKESRVPTLVSNPIRCRHHTHQSILFDTLQNAFSTRLAHLNFNLYPMLVVDLMHEFELGVWKNLFTHLIRMLYASNLALVHEVDQRYVQVKMLFIFLGFTDMCIQVSSGAEIWKGWYPQICCKLF